MTEIHPIKKKVLLLAVSCKNGGLCPGGLDLDDPKKWIRIVKDDGNAGSVQGTEIAFAWSLDIIEFDGIPMPMGVQKENWIIVNNSCKKLGKKGPEILDWAYENYPYHDFWGNYKDYLNEVEFDKICKDNIPSESIMKVTNVRIYRNQSNKAKIDFDWEKARYRIRGISMTDQEFYSSIRDGEVIIQNAYIVVSIPKSADYFGNLVTGGKRAYKFVSRVYGM